MCVYVCVLLLLLLLMLLKYLCKHIINNYNSIMWIQHDVDLTIYITYR